MILKGNRAIQKRNKAGKRFTILAVAEGAISKEDAKLPKKKYKEKLEARAKKYPSVSYEIADEIFKEIRQRSASNCSGSYSERRTALPLRPCSFHEDRRRRCRGDSGRGVRSDDRCGKRQDQARTAGRMCRKLKMVSPKDQTVKAAKQIGISLVTDRPAQ